MVKKIINSMKLSFLTLVAAGMFGSGTVSAAYVNTVALTITSATKQGSVPHFWEQCVGRGGMIECLKPVWQTAATIGSQEAGFKSVRGHGMLMGWDGVDSIGLFHWDGNVNDTPTYSYTIFDSLIRILTRCGLDPVMELDFCPKNLQPSGGNQISPPSNWQMWERFMANLAGHCIATYGQARVEKWYWESWNEPDYSGFFSGTTAQEDSMYKYLALGIKSADSNLIVGGPAVDNNGDDQAFLTFVENNHVPINFLSNHDYGGSGSGGTANPASMASDNATRDGLIKSSGLKIASVNTEYNSCYCGPGGSTDAAAYAMDSHVNAPFVAKTIKLVLDDYLQGDSLPAILSYWAISDCFDENGNNGASYMEEQGATATGGLPFGQVYGLITYQGIRKAAFNAFKLLHMMGSTRISCTGGTGTNDGVDAFATMNSDSTEVEIMVYNFYQTLAGFADSNLVHLTVNALPFPSGKTITVTHYRVDSLHSNAYAVWEKQGKPKTPTTAQWSSMDSAQWLAMLKPVSTFTYTVGTPWIDTIPMPQQSLSLLLLTDTATASGTLQQAGAHASLPALSIAGTMVRALNLQGSPLTVSIYSLQGRLLEHFSTMVGAIDLRKGLSTGSYIVHAQARGEKLTGKIVVRE